MNTDGRFFAWKPTWTWRASRPGCTAADEPVPTDTTSSASSPTAHCSRYSGSVASRTISIAGLLNGVTPPSWKTNALPPTRSSCGGK